MLTTPTRRLAYAVAAAAAAGAVALPAAPASAHYGQVVPAVECVTTPVDGRYRAIFSYTNYAASTTTVALGSGNAVTPSTLNGTQPTRFSPGQRRAAFTTTAVPVGTEIRWTVNGNAATARASSRSCGPQVSLPADGNGTGPLIALGISGLVTIAVLVVHKLRRRRA
ncbi:hypothetical protein GCM10010123_36370 [Pilimelia anulata]|uniref:Uncharacterized protein n=1 Tax=Pilimelia anulata TaxID=53371 RepID=A0A8J3BDS8_9ACTN|nr:hypothetical protein [Pilimelia anulata]GGK03163.1 hypothetical protein GCM10010123_36370 [Pilimelia anulata]